jgi:glycosyltransferase involved in cell wall biosynthesis
MLLNYPKTHFEIIFVNDNSTDNSVPLLTEFIIKNSNWKLLDNIRKSNSPKKDAIDIAIIYAKHDWIITTDADCEVPKNWLTHFDSFIANNSKVKMVAAPVSYKINHSFLHQFQLLDFLSLIGTTIGSFGIKKPFMCNGANLCYHKKTFIALKGFDGNNNIASGDDVFLLEKFLKKYPKQVHYLKSLESLVLTKPENSLKSLINQRIRWASKTSATKSVFGKLIGIVVFLESLLILWSVIFGLWLEQSFFVVLLIILLKLLVDYMLLKKTYQFIHQKLGMKTYLLSSLVYPFFIVFVVAKSFFTKVKWKDRVFEK